MDNLRSAAAKVAAKRRELELRLTQLHESHPLTKLAAARLVASTFFELVDHQAAFNEAAIAALEELGAGKVSNEAAARLGGGLAL